MLRTGGVSNGSRTLPDEIRARLECAEDAVWVTTIDGRIVLWNRAAERSLGFDAREVCGRTCAEILTGRDERGRARCGPGCSVMAGITRKIPATFGVPTRTKDGRDVWLEVMAVTTNGTESRRLVIHVFNDVTRARDLLRELCTHVDEAASEQRLTPRELDVLRLMIEGLGTAAAAERLRVSRATIRNHIQNIFGKLGVHTRLEAVAHVTRCREWR